MTFFEFWFITTVVTLVSIIAVLFGKYRKDLKARDCLDKYYPELRMGNVIIVPLLSLIPIFNIAVFLFYVIPEAWTLLPERFINKITSFINVNLNFLDMPIVPRK